MKLWRLAACILSHSEEEDTFGDQGFADKYPEGLICSTKGFPGTRVIQGQMRQDPLQNEHSWTGSVHWDLNSAHLPISL